MASNGLFKDWLFLMYGRTPADACHVTSVNDRKVPGSIDSSIHRV
jgi:hypothetical protein